MKYERFERKMMPPEKDMPDLGLSEGEEVLWQGKPKKSAFICNKVLAMMPIALIWAAFDSVFLIVVYGFDTPVVVRIIVTVFICIHLFPFWMWLSSVVTAGRRHKNVAYALTDRRIIIRGGLIGVEFRSVSYKDVVHVNMKIGLVDHFLKVGDLYFVAADGSEKTVFFDIETPGEVYKLAQKIVSDIQADIAFPNAYRPDENTGYGTKYRP